MKKFLLILFFGFLVWVIPYGAMLLLSFLEESNSSLYIISNHLIIVLVTVFFLVIYFKRSYSRFAVEGLLVGIVWFLINIGIGYLVNNSLAFINYLFSDGLFYLVIPVIALGFDLVAKRKVW